MNGVNVLYQEPIFKTIYANENIMNILVLLFIFMVFGILISAILISLKGTIIFFVLALITFFPISVLNSTSTKELDHYEYKVTIDDSVPMKEFLSKYEIINQEEEIFTIVEREDINEESK